MTVGLCAVQLGVLEYALQATARHTTEREQFGRPIATFQAVGHRAADAYIDVEGVRLTLWQAIYRLEAGLPAEVEVYTAKWWAAEAERLGYDIVFTAESWGSDAFTPLSWWGGTILLRRSLAGRGLGRVERDQWRVQGDGCE
jgi:3-oxocholest-4-en-26-oyl-CoA dehydrogenase beta subunit